MWFSMLQRNAQLLPNDLTRHVYVRLDPFSGRSSASSSDGLVDINCYEVTEFGFVSTTDAIAHAAQTSGPFNKTVLLF